MSEKILFIATIHAAFPIIGYFINNKIGLLLGTVIGVLIAIFLGSSKYSGIDILGVGVGVFVCLFFMKETKNHNK